MARMIKGIVHNLRGPLGVALASTQISAMKFDMLLSAAGMDSAGKDLSNLAGDIKHNQHKVMEAISRTNDLVDTLLMQGGSNPKEKAQTINLNEMIHKEYHFLRSDVIVKHRVAVEFSLAQNLSTIVGKYSDFSQVFYNLVKNACEAMAEESKKQLTISSQTRADKIILAFSDTGPGIPPDKLPHIFDPFYSTKSEDMENRSGSGLGLFVTSRLMAAYGATVTAENRTPKGSVFSITIPLSNRDENTR